MGQESLTASAAHAGWDKPVALGPGSRKTLLTTDGLTRRRMNRGRNWHPGGVRPDHVQPCTRQQRTQGRGKQPVPASSVPVQPRSHGGSGKPASAGSLLTPGTILGLHAPHKEKNTQAGSERPIGVTCDCKVHARITLLTRWRIKEAGIKHLVEDGHDSEAALPAHQTSFIFLSSCAGLQPRE